jgi:Protein of unknown function DUF2620
MTTVVITGLARDRAAALASDAAAPDITVTTSSDYDGAVALQTGEADYYIGICQSGAGGALAFAIGLVGSKRARTVAPAGRPLDEQAVVTALAEGVVAFGVALDQVDAGVGCIIRAIGDRPR